MAPKVASSKHFNDVLILLGGGIDSTALIPFYGSRGSRIRGLHVHYHQPSFAGERRAVQALAKYYKIPITAVDIGLPIVSRQGEYVARNALLVLAAASILKLPRLQIGIGIHSGTPYYDCTRGFLKDIQNVLDGYSGGAVIVDAPFVDFSKREVFEFALQNAVPLDLTFSCERRSDRPCGRCLSCKDRKALYVAR